MEAEGVLGLDVDGVAAVLNLPLLGSGRRVALRSPAVGFVPAAHSQEL